MERAASGSRALFPKGPSFTLEDFSNKDFIVRDFVDSLAESAIPPNRRSGQTQQAFDPKPLIRSFESRQPLASLTEYERLADADCCYYQTH
jgi:exocyst complex component 5